MKTLALGFEETLISNTTSQIPRNGLSAFLDNCADLVGIDNIVMYTPVSELIFREIAESLHKENLVPNWLTTIHYISWNGKKQKLSFINQSHSDQVLLIDSHEEYIYEDQKNRWLRVSCFSDPYAVDDELNEVFKKIKWILFP